MKIDKNRCIQCLWCLEVCQKGAIDLLPGALIRICSGVRKIMGKDYYYGKKV
ncbi:MAG: 4Fe-4S binding protein [Deltaproteobacteria bacterium]|nr:4Fe-4S binding protein [Deltaproteobacteria bacterium]